MEATLGQRIGLLRRKKNLKQDALAEMLGVSPQAVSKWENNQSCPDISLLPRLARILEVTVDELLSGEKPRSEIRIVPEEERKDMKDLLLRIVVDSRNGDKVRVNLPVSLLQVALDMGMSVPQLSGSDALKNIDLNQILEMIRHGAVGNLVEVESASGDVVRIFVE